MSAGRGGATGPRRRPWAALAIVGLTLLVAVADLKSLRDLREARSTAGRLEDRIGEAEERLAELERRRAELATGEAALERLAREDLGLVKPGDVVIVVQEEEDVVGEAKTGAAQDASAESAGVEGP